MADKSNQLVLTALSRAAAAAVGVPLFGSKNVAGLFPTNAAGKQAAQRCQDEGYLYLVCDTETFSANGDNGDTLTLVKKKSAKTPLCTITDKGLNYLLSQVSPRQVLEDFVRALEARESQVDELLDLARHMRHHLEAIKANVDRVLQQTCQTERGGTSGGLKALLAGFLSDSDAPRSTSSPTDTATALHEAILSELTRWQHAGASEDCPLPHLFRQVSAASIGQFHDALRRLHDQGKLYLHPWTGPLYEIPEPPYALLIGHEIAYYASIRK